MTQHWVLYHHPETGYHFQNLYSSEPIQSTNPADYGIDPKCEIILVLQKASFIAAYLKGVPRG